MRGLPKVASAPFSSTRSHVLRVLGIPGVARVADTGVLFTVARIQAATATLFGVTQRLLRPAPVHKGQAPPRDPPLPPLPEGALEMALLCACGIASVPLITEETGIAAGRLRELLDRHQQCHAIACTAAEARDQGTDGLRLCASVSQVMVGRALAYITERLRTASNASERQRIVTVFATFIGAVNKQQDRRNNRSYRTRLKKRRAT